MTRRWREPEGVGDRRRMTCLSYGFELPSAEAYERARELRATFDESFLTANRDVYAERERLIQWAYERAGILPMAP